MGGTRSHGPYPGHRHHYQHHDYRRHHHRHGPRPLLLFLAMILLWTAGPTVLEVLATSLFAGIALLLTLAVVGMVVTGVAVHRAVRRHRRPVPGTVSVPAPRREPDWAAVRSRFETLRSEYAAYECDPLAVLRLPALADVSVASTGRFVDAFAHAQALHTDERPPSGMAAEYREAVDTAERAWRAAREAAERIRLAGLSPAERTAVNRVVKMLTMAQRSGHDAERQAAYAKAREELARLEQAGLLRLPTPAAAALEEASRASLHATPFTQPGVVPPPKRPEPA
jgi:hypothetical protein